MSILPGFAIFKTLGRRRNSLVVGHIDTMQRRALRGWAADRCAPRETLVIDVIHRGRLICSRPADLARPDLRAIGLEPNHGFEFTIDVDIDAADPQLVVFARRQGDPVGLQAKTNLTHKGRVQAPRQVDERAAPAVSLKPDAVFVDVGDLVAYLRIQNSVTGIQRVVSGLIRSVADDVDMAGYDNVHFAMTAPGNEDIVVLPLDDLAALVRAAEAGLDAAERLGDRIDDMIDRAVSFRPRHGDVYFVAGAYWIVDDFTQRLNQMRSRGVAIALCIYDLIPITHSQYVPPSERERLVERAVGLLLLADFCVTISEFVRRQVEALMAIELACRLDVRAIPLPHQLREHRKAKETMSPDKPFDGRTYVLCVGTLEGRKNHILLYRVWAALIRKHGASRVPDLVLVGRWGWNIEGFRTAIDGSHSLDGKIRILSDVGDDDLSQLYRNCMFTVFPSFVEGWGLPVGESLSNGKLCLAAASSSIPEVGGDFCVYFDPHSFFAAYETIEQFIVNPRDLLAHERYIAGHFRPRLWSDFSKSLLDALRRGQAAAQKRPRRAVAPNIDPGVVYALNRQSVEKETVPWRAKALRFCLAGDWGQLEDWGVWAVGSKVTLRFRLPRDQAGPSRLFLELRVAPGAGGDGGLDVTYKGRTLKHLSLLPGPAWTDIPLPDVEEGYGEIAFEARFRPRVEASRDLYFGLSRLVCLPCADDEKRERTEPVDALQRALEASGQAGGSIIRL